MYYQKRGGYYSFVFYDFTLKKNRRLPQSQTPHFGTDQEANAFCREWDQKHGSVKSRAEDKTRWTLQFPKFVELLEMYGVSRKEDAPYSWQSNVYYVKYHVLDFFLLIKKETNVNHWFRYFEEFRAHLQIAPCLKKIEEKRETLAYSTMNQVIKSLNNFLTVLHRRQHIDYAWKCRLFPKYKCKKKGLEAIIEPAEQKRIYETLKLIDGLSATFFLVCLHTGLRWNELRGLSLDDFFQGSPPAKSLLVSLKPYDFEVHGYIALESQPSPRGDLRDLEGRVFRQPLKQKKEIGGDSSRTIPIFSRECFNLLVHLWNLQLHKRKSLPNSKLGPKDFLLFDGLNRNSYSAHFRKARGSDHSFTPHDTRHTYAAWLAEETGGDHRLCKIILGHSSETETNRYMHLSARINQQVKSKLQLQRPMVLVPEESLGQVIDIHRKVIA